MILTKVIAVTGSDGYLGSSVMQALFAADGITPQFPVGCSTWRREASTAVQSYIAPEGLRGHSACRMWIDNNVTASDAARCFHAIPLPRPLS